MSHGAQGSAARPASFPLGQTAPNAEAFHRLGGGLLALLRYWTAGADVFCKLFSSPEFAPSALRIEQISVHAPARGVGSPRVRRIEPIVDVLGPDVLNCGHAAISSPSIRLYAQRHLRAIPDQTLRPADHDAAWGRK